MADIAFEKDLSVAETGIGGLKATIDWYVANESWWRPAKEATEARYKAQGQ